MPKFAPMDYLLQVTRGMDFNPAMRYHVFIQGQPATMHETNNWFACKWYEIKLGWIAFNTFPNVGRVYTIVSGD
ncbi:hypothetical protein [Rhizobium phage RHph_N46]|nr:hypothetical protein [Rhizobium phage RHph_N46]